MAQDRSKNKEFRAPGVEELAPLFPSYRLEAFIAQGGMGAVYKATQISLDRPVAIKILPAEFGNDPKFRASFEAEAKAMARLNHPNLISVYDFGDVQGMLFIVMEFVQGKALYYSSHRKAIDPAVALDLVSKICRGLGHAHRGGIIHRDIKPANILLDTEAQPKVGDFGLAHSLDRGRDESVIFGTPGYTAPEVLVEGSQVDARSDIFSVGVVLYELISGKQPEPHSHHLSTGTDSRIDAIIKKATQSNPSLRHATVDELADELDKLIPQLSGPKFATASTASPPRPPLAGPTTVRVGSKSRSGVLVFWLFFILLIGGALGAWYFLRDPVKKIPPVESLPLEDAGDPTNKKEEHKKKSRRQKRRKNEEHTPSSNRPPKRKPKPKPTDPDKPQPADEKGTETPLEALARLAPDLRDGKREEFPPQTLKNDSSAFLLIEREMTWDEANRFAMTHGAHLAVAPTPDDLTWLHENVTRATPVWMGASDSGFETKWHWLDGRPVASSLWAEGSPDNATRQSSAGEDFAALASEQARLEDHFRLRKLPCLLQWRLDGTNPASFQAQLARTGRALENKKSPVFPAGTDNIGGSRFLLVEGGITWEDASALAAAAGGHLAVPSNEKEVSFLALTLKNELVEDQHCWIGGRRSPQTPEIWQYLTSESFTFLTWLPGEPGEEVIKEDRLALKNSEGRIGACALSGEEEGSHFFIEWSAPSRRNMPTLSALDLREEELLEALEEVREDLRQDHGRDYRKYRKARDEVVEDFLENAITTINNQERLNSTVKARLVEEVKKFLDDNRLPEELPRAAPNELRGKLKTARSRVEQLDADYLDSFEKAKADYLEALTQAAKAVLKNGEEAKAAMFILEKSVTAEDDKRFERILDDDRVPLPEKPPAEDEDKPGDQDDENGPGDR